MLLSSGRWIFLIRITTCGLAIWFTSGGPILAEVEESPQITTRSLDRSPVDLALSADGTWLVTANETSDSVSLVGTSDLRVLDEAVCGTHPAAIAICPDQQTVLVTASYSGEVIAFNVAAGKLQRLWSLRVGFEPYGIAVAPNGNKAYVGLVASGRVAEIDLTTPAVTRTIDVGAWPRYLTLSPDGSRLAVGCSGEGNIKVVDTARGEVLYEEGLTGGINLGHMTPSADGKYAYFTWMVYRSNPITAGNIRLGWVLASRIGRVRLDGSSYREAISLDVPRRAIADPHGLAIGADGKRLVAAASGTHELLVYRLADLPFIGIGGPGDLIDRKLLADDDLFYRIELGGRPMGLQLAADSRTAYVANYLNNSVQVVDIESRKVLDEVSLGMADKPSLARRGAALFYDGQRSLDQWYSCHSCHYNGGTNAKPMDTMNDGSALTMKTVLPLYDVHETSPWTWHGWQTDLTDAMHKSFTVTMLGNPITDDESQAVLAYLKELKAAPNPFRNPDGSFSTAAARGREVFFSKKAACANCHSGPHFSDGLIHDVGLGSDQDRYDGYNTPSLRGVYRKVRLLHDGRGKSLEAILTGPHSPDKVAGEGELTSQELEDLVAYLRSL